jgi:hypothetical protein
VSLGFFLQVRESLEVVYHTTGTAEGGAWKVESGRWMVEFLTSTFQFPPSMPLQLFTLFHQLNLNIDVVEKMTKFYARHNLTKEKDHQELFVSLFTVEGWPLIGHCVTKNINYALRAARSQPANRPAVGWPPAGRIVMTP